MLYLKIATASLLGLAAVQALGQVPAGADPTTGARPGHDIGVGVSLPMSDRASNIVPTDTRSNIAPTLPSPNLQSGASLPDYLQAARASLVAGRTGEAQQSLEMAETRALSRSVSPDRVGVPSSDPLIGQITDARKALGEGNTTRAIQLIDLALAG